MIALAASMLVAALYFQCREQRDAPQQSYSGAEDWRVVSGNGVHVNDKTNEGERIYKANCVACHQPDGHGLPGIYPALARSEWVLGPDGRIVRIVLDGLNGPVRVRGTEFNSIMPSFRHLLSDEEIASVLTHARKAWANTASAVSPEVVGEIRRSTEGRVGSWTSAELAEIH